MFKGAFSHFRDTGCLLGSSQHAAQILTTPLNDKKRAPKHILEVGAGTGAVTVSIIEKMIPGDTLTINEMHPKFVDALKARIEKMEKYQQLKDDISFFVGPIQEFQPDKKFDVIVCALPFLNFTIPLIQEVFDKLASMSGKDTVMTYFEYLGIRPISKIISPESRRDRIKAIDAFFKEKAPPRISTETCWLNILPINVYTLDMAA